MVEIQYKFVDEEFTGRLTELINATWDRVEHKRKVRRVKQALYTYRDVNMKKAVVPRSGKRAFAANCLVGAGVAFGVGAVAVGGGAIVLGTAIGFGAGKAVGAARDAYRKSHQKKVVLRNIKQMMDGTPPKMSDSKAVEASEAFVKVLILDTTVKLPNALFDVHHDKKYQHFDKGAIVTGAANQVSNRDVHRSIRKGPFADSKLVAGRRVARIRAYQAWLTAYLLDMQNQFKEQQERVLKLQDTVYAHLHNLVARFDLHWQNCTQSTCFGPGMDPNKALTPQRLTEQEKQDLADLLRGIPDSELARLHAPPPPPNVPGDDVDDSDDQREDAEGVGELLGIGKDAGLNYVGTIPDYYSGAGAGANVGLPIAAEVLGLAIGEVLEWRNTNKPLYKRLTGLRSSIREGEDVGDDFRDYAGAGDLSALLRALRKLHHHYFRKVERQIKKLKKLLNKIESNGNELKSCQEAVKLLSTYLQVVKSYDKAMIHLIFVKVGVEALADRACQLASLDTEDWEEQYYNPASQKSRELKSTLQDCGVW